MAQVVAQQLPGPAGTEVAQSHPTAVDEELDLAMSPQTEDPDQPLGREPPPDAKKPRCGDLAASGGSFQEEEGVAPSCG